MDIGVTSEQWWSKVKNKKEYNNRKVSEIEGENRSELWTFLNCLNNLKSVINLIIFYSMPLHWMCERQWNRFRRIQSMSYLLCWEEKLKFFKQQNRTRSDFQRRVEQNCRKFNSKYSFSFVLFHFIWFLFLRLLIIAKCISKHFSLCKEKERMRAKIFIWANEWSACDQVFEQLIEK